MCTVSFVGEHYRDRWTSPPNQYWPVPQIDQISRYEFEQLKRDVEEMKELLRAAKRIDEVTGQPDCEMDEKLEVLRKVAKLVGVDLDDVLGAK